MERVFLLMEAWGYPRQGTDWLRKRRLFVIAALAILCWLVFLLAGWTVYAVVGQLAELAGSESPSTS